MMHEQFPFGFHEREEAIRVAQLCASATGTRQRVGRVVSPEWPWGVWVVREAVR